MGHEVWKAVSEKIRELLRDISERLPIAKFRNPPLKPYFPSVLKRMIEAAKRVDTSLTPMSAVSGAVADELLDFVEGFFQGDIVVNNGGDIAARVSEGLAVGISTRPFSRPSYRVFVGGGKFGVATSGWMGRSFSKGVADAAFVVAETSSLADAAATFVANCVLPENPRAVLRVRAELLDPGTDIKGEMVVVGEMMEERDKITALSRGMKALLGLVEKGIVKGGAIFVEPYFRAYGVTVEKII